MNLRLLLGVLVPLILIIVLTVLSTSQTGFSEEIETVDSVSMSKLLADHNQPRERLPLQSVTLTNDHFLPRRHEIESVTGCLVGEDTLVPKHLSLTIMEGSYLNRGTSIVGDLLNIRQYRGRSIEIGAHATETYTIFAEQIRPFDYEQRSAQYTGYDAVLIVKGSLHRYGACERLTADERAAATRIPII